MDSETSSSAPMPTLSRLAFKAVCGQLEKSLSNEKASASFACGGTIPVECMVAANLPRGIAEEVPGLGERLKSSRPINIFWELKDEPTARKLTLPLDSSVDNDSPNSLNRLRQLVSDCEPAPFGRHQETVLDPTYRKAGKLETHQFATTFHPADFGLVERVEQVLLPTMQSLTEEFLRIRRLDIELYKLNIYSGPSGLFKSHVDTPRSGSQIGSLVVCLPSPFQGGNLVVRHEGREVNFDWDQRSADTIQWAAFYSDCEHEIKTVNQGDRITLTYNLYAVSELLEKSSRISAIIDLKSLPLYKDFKNLIGMPAFMKTGGVLGAFCSHAYAHSTSDASILLPRGLKGADLAFFSALHASGVKVDVLPVMLGHGVRDLENDWWDLDEADEEDQYFEYKPCIMRTPNESKEWGWDHDYNSDQQEWGTLGHENDDGGDFDALPDMLGHENRDKNSKDCKDRVIFDWGGSDKNDEADHDTNADKEDEVGDNDREKTRSDREKTRSDREKTKYENKGNQDGKSDDTLVYLDPGAKVRVGKCLNPYVAADTCGRESFTEILREHWPTQLYEKPITWVTAPRPENMRAAMAYLGNAGNEVSQAEIYSYAAIIAVIPPWTERQELLAKLKDQ